jgi:hypothetical protein
MLYFFSSMMIDAVPYQDPIGSIIILLILVAVRVGVEVRGCLPNRDK